MTIYTTMSAKGQVVLPKQQRDQLGWQPGTRLAIVVHPGGMTLRDVPADDDKVAAADAVARMRARASYRGPPISIEEMDLAVRDAAAERHAAT